MKKIIYSLCLLALGATGLSAQRVIRRQLPVSGLELRHRSEEMKLDMSLEASKFSASKDQEYILTPVLVSADGGDSVVFRPVIIAGRNLYYRHVRNNSHADAGLYRSGKTDITYTSAVDYQPWMDNAVLKINTCRQGCCDKPTGNYSDPVARIRRVEYTPVFGYVSPVADSVKEFKLEGSAFINFPVNRTELYPTYMNNPAELAKITGTIDSVKGDPDVTITSIFIKGFASPEGPYSNNVRLAKGRTATLKAYVENLYSFPSGFITTDYLPENWPGLKAYMQKSQLANRDAILAIIDRDMDEDAKNALIERSYPNEYAFLLANVYPGLRRSDYIINYNVKSYTTLEEILKVLHTAPQKLSLSEFYRAAQSMTPGSDEYNEVFETAVRMYPSDEVANLNAANSAMRRGDYNGAARYLDRAGRSPEVTYARGVLAALRKDYGSAESYFRQAASEG
ncbi:MAG: DUF3868 domain-containing protein, partial [Paramuribaculum sp.]|nr:DUF3868 domain-containing protein [Paramuribaculum sp.]